MRFTAEWYETYTQKKKGRAPAGKPASTTKATKRQKGIDWLAPVIFISVHAKALAALAKNPDLRKGKQEHFDQVQIFDYFCRNDQSVYDCLYAIPNGGKRPKKTAAEMEAEGAKRGYPDMGLEIPAGVYHGMRIEQKHGKRKPSDEQAKWLRRLSAMGFYVVLSFSPDETINTIKRYVALKPGEGMPAHENDVFWRE